MGVKNLRKALEDIQAVFVAAKTPKLATELQSFVRIFDGRDEEKTSEFIAQIKERLNKTRATPQLPAADQTILHYVTRLKEAGVSEPMFELTFKELSKDTKVKKGEADAIAATYTGGRQSWPKKADALKAIKVAFNERVYEAAKMRQVDKASRF